MALKHKKSDTINIQSFVRVRPLGAKEKKSPNLECEHREVTIRSSSDFQKLSKSFLFDRVFEENSKQVVVYSTIVRPMIKEVIQGYNCTVFAYGQTGTGKTYTMTGPQEYSDISWAENAHAGIIPRALEDIFTELSNQPCEYQVTISYMELYNERLRSLLRDSDDDINIQLIDDLDGGVILKGLSPTPVKSKDEAFKLLQKGTEKKEIAATLMNINSSRSHTIFTINVNVKENALVKDDILRLGKLHLVDLAGSENVSKSGASERVHKSATGVNKRLAEASNINKSLLTLGRVITSITENNPHIPYRESKLTRLLRDSLGGKTKTCIIGTISPCHSNMDESESTLNYVSKARSIKNKPEKNRTISKQKFMQSASEEITKLKRDLEAVRQGDGFFISRETHVEMTTRTEELNSQVNDWCERYNNLNASFDSQKELFCSLKDDYEEKCAEYEEFVILFQTKSKELNEQLAELKKEVTVREFLIKEYQKRETSLTEDAKKYKSVLEVIVQHNETLHDNISRKANNEKMNIKQLEEFKHGVAAKLEELDINMGQIYSNERNIIKDIQSCAGKALDVMTDHKSKLKEHVADFDAMTQKKMSDLLSCKQDMINKFENEYNLQSSVVRDDLLAKLNEVEEFKIVFDSEAQELRNNLESMIERATAMTEHLRTMMELCRMPKYISQARLIYDEITKCIVTKAHQLSLNIELVAKHSSRSTESADLAYRKLQKLAEDVADLQSTLRIASTSTKECQNRIECVQDTYKNIPQNIEKMMDLKDTLMFNLEHNMSEIQRSLKTGEEESVKMTTQLSNFAEGILRNNTSLGNGILNVQVSLKSLENGHVNSKNRFLHTIETFNSNLDEKCQVVSEEPNQFFTDLNELVEKMENNIEMELRKQSSCLVKQSQNISQFEELTSNTVDGIRQHVQEMQYSLDQPKGTTPQRVKLSDLDYPKDVESTAPLELLRQRFNREQGICVNDTFELQPQPASLSQTDSGTSDVRVSTRNLSVGNTVQSKKILRRSKSMPDVLNTTETTEEEKENLSQQKISKNTKKRNKNSDFKKANNVRRVLSSMNNTSNS